MSDAEPPHPPDPELVEALCASDDEKVGALIAGGVDIRYRDADGYDALLHAVHGGDPHGDARLLQLLLDAGVDRNGVTRYQESAVRVLSHVGRFDAVKLLLDAGAQPDQLAWTPLIAAVALGSLAEVQARIAEGAPLEEVDWWERTAFLIALLAGDIAKAEALLTAGANPNARGRCGAPALFHAIEGRHPDVVRWLLQKGQPVDDQDQFGTTSLDVAVGRDNLDCVEVLLAAGANIEGGARESALHRATSAAMARRLLAAGADPAELSQAARRELLGYPGEPDKELVTVSREDFQRGGLPRFGATNPERVHEPFWNDMIRSGISAFVATGLFEARPGGRGPVWCAQRFGQSLTFLPDGRIVQIGGEHEDWYDSDFCIYNDLFVHGRDGSVVVYVYPESAFPPTDFHTATLAESCIYVIGSLGYQGKRRFGETPIHRLDLDTFRMERVSAGGDPPGWISRHRATLLSPREIRVWGGEIARLVDGKEAQAKNEETFVLDLGSLIWRRDERR